MPLEHFKASEPLTLGVELELQLVNPYDRDLLAGASDLLELLSRKPFPGDVKPEITESMIEIATDVHTGYEPMLAQLRAMRDTLVDACDRLNIAICGGGTHPFQRWFKQRIFAQSRFKQLSGLYGYLAKQFTVFGQHVHVGCATPNEALYLLHALNRYVPHFIALSASSPYSQGVDTLFDSARLNSVFAFPLSGRAPFLLDWDEFERSYFAKMEATGVVKSMKDFYWDIRPKPEYGTIELRVCDTPLTIERAAALACYLQSLCRWLLTEGRIEPDEDDYLVYTYNRFQACRFGLDGMIVDPRTREPVTIREDLLKTVRTLERHGTDLGCAPALEHVYGASATGGNDATHLRNTFAGSETMAAVVAESVRRFRS